MKRASEIKQLAEQRQELAKRICSLSQEDVEAACFSAIENLNVDDLLDSIHDIQQETKCSLDEAIEELYKQEIVGTPLLFVKEKCRIKRQQACCAKDCHYDNEPRERSKYWSAVYHNAADPAKYFYCDMCFEYLDNDKKLYTHIIQTVERPVVEKKIRKKLEK